MHSAAAAMRSSAAVGWYTPAGEQPQSKLLLGRVQPPKDGRVVDPKRPRCASEALRPCHGEQEAQVIPIVHGGFDANPTCRIANWIAKIQIDCDCAMG
jgi:hypothetical protein